MNTAPRFAVSTVAGVSFFGAALFLPAGSLDYWQAWVFIAVFTVDTVVPSIYLAIRMPDALARRLRAGPAAESRTVQRVAITATALALVVMLVTSALDHRFGWSSVPLGVVVLGDVLVIVGLLVAQLVVTQNAYAAATITVEADQSLVSTGLYGVVRHPMYLGALIVMAGIPIALDSYWGLTSLVPAALALAARILDEEKMLTRELVGYDDYVRRVRYRLLPGVW